MNPPNLSFFLSGNSEGEKLSFSTTPLYDSLDDEDVDAHLEFSDRACREIFTHSFDHNVDSLAIDISKPLVFGDLPSDEVETPQDFDALQPESMVCQVLTVLRSILLLIINLLKHPRLLITLLFALKINLIHRLHILHQNHMIIALMHWRRSM